MEAPFFSIVIPVYNGLTHDLPVCLESIWGQQLDKRLYEVICVNDCSTDNTLVWLKLQQSAHNNLYIIDNQQNMRQGECRNKGMATARGKYILFIDADDYFHKNSITEVYNFIRDKDLDVLVSDSAYQLKGYEHNNLQLNLKFCEESDSETFIKENGFTISPWRLCFNREFYQKHNISFVENTNVEDVDWSLKVIHYAKKNSVSANTVDSLYKIGKQHNRHFIQQCIYTYQ